MVLTAAAAATTILANASKTLNAARERAKASKDTELKALINTLYDEMAALREAVLRIREENIELQVRATQQVQRPQEPEIRQIGEAYFYFLGETGPFCQPCYDENHKLVRLQPPQDYAGGRGRKCEVCNKVFFEGPSTGFRQIRIERG